MSAPDIVISLSKICDHDLSYTRHVICTNNQCRSMQQHPGEHNSFSNMTRRTSCRAFAAHFWSERYIRQIKYIFCAALVDFGSCDITVVSSLKRLKSCFAFRLL